MSTELEDTLPESPASLRSKWATSRPSLANLNDTQPMVVAADVPSIDKTIVGGIKAPQFDDHPMTIATRPMPAVPRPAPRTAKRIESSQKTIVGGFAVPGVDITAPMEALPEQGSEDSGVGSSAGHSSSATLCRLTQAARALQWSWTHAGRVRPLEDAYGLMHLIYERVSMGKAVELSDVRQRLSRLDEVRKFRAKTSKGDAAPHRTFSGDSNE